jgi:integrase
MRVHVAPTFGKIRLSSLTAQQVQQLYARKLDSGLSPTTVQHIHAVLHSALDNALRHGLVQRNVADLVDAPGMRHREMQPLNAEQANMLLAAASSTRLEALYVLALTMGMREGELLALRWRDVDLDARHIDARHIDARHIDARHIDARHIDARHIDARHIHVQHTLQQIPERPPEIASAKTSQSRRKIALTSKAIEALRRHRALQIEERMRIGPVWTDWDLVYCNTVGNPLMEVRYCTVDCAHS